MCSSDLAETELMLLAAKTGRRYWEVAGTWLEVERAEYRLAMSLLAAGHPKAALVQAKLCVAICEDHGVIPYDHFFGWVATATASYRSGDPLNAKLAYDKAASLIDRMKPEVQPDCRAALAKLGREVGC